MTKVENMKNKNNRIKKRFLVCIAVFLVVNVIIMTICMVSILSYINDIVSSRKEHDSLKEYSSLLKIDKGDPISIDKDEHGILTKIDKPYVSDFDREMLNINSDYLCWIKIDGTVIDYPVVRGKDNEKYLNLSFYGNENSFGTLFMDYRCEGDYVPHIIIYGHNSRNSDMFGGLRKFLDKVYLTQHPYITIIVNDRIAEYEIFAARKTTVDDIAYNLDFINPETFQAFAESCGAKSVVSQIITLSTCVSGTDEDERIIVQGMLKQ